MTGLVPSHTTCKPCAAVAAGSADPVDAEDSSAGTCLSVSPYKMQRGLEDIPSPCPSSNGSQGAVASRYLMLSQQVRGVGRRTSRSTAHEGCQKAVARLGCTASAACWRSRRWMAPGCCCRWLSVAQPAQPAIPTERRLVGCCRTPQLASGADYDRRPGPQMGLTVHIYRSA
jgi:hypothetical protein